MAHYESLQAILEEAGLSHAVYAEEPSGVVDGDNKLFTVASKPLSDSNNDDEISIADVQAYVDGTPVSTALVDTQFGIITLTDAPAVGTKVSVDYRYSAVSLDFVSKLRDEAEAWINTRMRGIDPCAPYGVGEEVVPAEVRNLCRNYAAAYLLIRDYGFNQDIEGTSKDGYKRLSEVRKSLTEYALAGGNCGEGSDGGSDGATGDIEVCSEGNLFPKFDEGTRPNSDGDW